MTAWGIACNIESGDPVVVAVSASGDVEELSGQEVFRHRSVPGEDWAQKLRGIEADLDTAIRRGPPDAIVIRSMDLNKFHKEGPNRKPYQVEGILLAVARRHTDLVECRTGKEIGEVCGMSKAEAEAKAAAVFGEEL